MGFDVRARVSVCAQPCIKEARGRRAAGSTLARRHVSQKGRKVFPANSLHSSVSELSAAIRRLHGRKHNLFDATLPTRPEPSSSRRRSSG